MTGFRSCSSGPNRVWIVVLSQCGFVSAYRATHTLALSPSTGLRLRSGQALVRERASLRFLARQFLWIELLRCEEVFVTVGLCHFRLVRPSLQIHFCPLSLS